MNADTGTSQALDAARERLAGEQGQAYWKSLDELAQTPEFRARVTAEFPLQAEAPLSDVTRRNFLQVMGASLALAGVTTGCARQPTEKIRPYVKPPEELLPGEPLYFASAFVLGGYAQGILAESNMGRPVKIEGLPEHPGSLGGTSAMAQASLLDLYDPDRGKGIEYYGDPGSWDDFVIEARGLLDTLRPQQGRGIRILTETVTSPTLAAMIAQFIEQNPRAVWHQYEPVNDDNARRASMAAFGEFVDTHYAFDKADLVVSLDADFLGSGPAHVRYSRDFAKRRDVVDHHEGEEHHTLSRVYAIEGSPTITGASADHCLAVRPSRVETIARAIAAEFGLRGVAAPAEALNAEEAKWVTAIAEDLKAHRGASIVIAGDRQPAAVHVLAHALNHANQAVGQTVFHTEPVEANPGYQSASLEMLVNDMNAGSVEFLLMFDGNPVYNAPRFAGEAGDIRFQDALNKVPNRVHLALSPNETSEWCHWYIPRAHDLETWGDARAYDGTVSLIQPLIAPFYNGKSPLELLSVLTENEERSAYDVVKGHWAEEHWAEQRPGGNFDSFWAESLSSGMIASTQAEGKVVRLASNLAPATPADASVEGYDVVFVPDPMVWDGRFAGNAWLQEIPKPLTKLTWDNAVMMSLQTAEDLGVDYGDMVEVTVDGRTIEGPAFLQPGHPDGVLTMHLGYGRRKAGKVGTGMGFDAYTVRPAASPNFVSGATVRKISGRYELATTEEHFNLDWQNEAEARALIRVFTQKQYDADPEIVHHALHTYGDDYTLYDREEKQWHGNQWGMTIDLNKCTGCSACIVACQAENNIPVVGKSEVANGREMHWIRVDRYYKGDPSAPQTGFQPLPCMQCEQAPCEVVCPVGATQHSKEGLNDMVYNRCIGTRYCSNNCPYKVRRFNFYNYGRTPLGAQGERMLPKQPGPKHVYPESIKAMYNPEVTVRTRGVMEKCTYCVQRINSARIDAKKKGLDLVPDGAVRTACEQACPSAAITFGNLNVPQSKVAELKSSHRNYALLGDISTIPRTTYLARLTNPNETITPPPADDAHGHGDAAPAEASHEA